MAKISRLSPEQRSDLVAYLDGELEETATRQIEQTLAGSPVARHEVEMLTRTWELLDELPTMKASAEFTQKTLSIMEVPETAPPLSARPWFPQARRGAIVTAWVIGLAIVAWVGFAATNQWVPDPRQQLLEDLPVVEKLDQYSEIGSSVYLRKLSNSGLFNE